MMFALGLILGMVWGACGVAAYVPTITGNPDGGMMTYREPTHLHSSEIMVCMLCGPLFLCIRKLFRKLVK